jgi:N-methylhydantoinase B/oxoprolinase/acetone carboxylase alpha subunit
VTARRRPRTRPDPVELELFTHRFEAIAREMGEMLRATAISTNVRERLDFSCALLDPDGALVVNAPHIPVHLGALGLCVRRLREAIEMRPGDVVVTNHPAFGGSHLPDVTVVTPVYAAGPESAAHGRTDGGSGGRRDDRGGGAGGRTGRLGRGAGHRLGGRGGRARGAAERARGPRAVVASEPGRPPLLGYVASRAHHAELGGSRPGSMPPAARTLAEEGVVIAPRRLVAGGRARWGALRRLLAAGPYPSRAVEENLADLDAAVAANHRGAEALRRLAAAHGRAVVARHMRALAARAATLLRAALGRLADGRYEAVERLDDGTPLQVAIEIAGERAVVDFTGSGPVHPGNLNATPAVVRSAVLYVLRLLVAEPLPLNEGLFAPVEIVLPRGLLDPPFPRDPRRAPAVVGGNVETSQRLVDVLLKALGPLGPPGDLGIPACSQGTMNNVLFGGDRFGYYETVGGGTGAGPGFAGASAVHSHMTNTRATDPEVLERRYPVRLERFAVRRGSGGAGRWRGGDGAVRELTFLQPMSLSIVSQHRVEAPYGLAGGGPGARGRQRVVRADGEVVELGPIDGCEVEPGDRLILETPGGGGWGEESGA